MDGALRSSMRFSSEPHRPAHDLCHAADRRAVDYLAGVWVRLGITPWGESTPVLFRNPRLTPAQRGPEIRLLTIFGTPV